eukprot:TRINITY_DN69054_c0_g1_i1.p1 TRINITY_DN69054_c0_g1~~TRINITY_DN69054_c0_g1_i1.p1  ORF type:complete len:881 (+),score=157.90 TRINITY_DN69054_c0_g1_i1:46-2688(+)
MTSDDRGVKRLPDNGLTEVSEKRPRLDEELIFSPPSSGPDDELVSLIEQLARIVRERPFGFRRTDFLWSFKRRLYKYLPYLVVFAEEEGRGSAVRIAFAGLVDQLVRSGYAQTPYDRVALVAMGTWKFPVGMLDDDGDGAVATDDQKDAAVHLYVHLAEHVNYYDDFSGSHPEFWDPTRFRRILRRMPRVFVEISEDIEADEWEAICPDLEAVLRTLDSFLVFWTSNKDIGKFNFDVEEAVPLLDSVVTAIATFDDRFGAKISAKHRGDPLEELTRLVGVLTQIVSEKFDAEESRRGDSATKGVESARRQAMLLLNINLKTLMLRIPTCTPKAESLTGGPIPVDERQQDAEWFQNLYERCEGTGDEAPAKPQILSALFKVMAEMPLEEQRYRLECVSTMVPQFIATFASQLKQHFVPPELADLKTVMNTVLQDDASGAAELLEEVSFYPCLLDFATKRATIHGACDRLKLHAGAGEPIRLVVPRDNVLDGVCSTLNLQDQNARIDVPLEIEFRAGYADDAGNEVVDEGEDQGGLRRQWLDRASRHFISSDLFVAPSEDAAHLVETAHSSVSRASGCIFVPAPEAVCKCVQADWEEQFELFGCVLGFAILYKETIPVHLGHNFLRSVFGHKTDAEDLMPLIESVDKTLHTKLRYILDGGYQALGDTLHDVLDQGHLPKVFKVNESHCQELVQSTLLKEGGDKIEVTEENKEEYVMLLLDRVLITGIAKQVACFRRGLLRVVPNELVQRIGELMPVKEIELMVCGADGIDVADWEKHTQYEDGYSPDSQPVKWFWEVVRDLSDSGRSSLLSFTTGSSQVPSGGFRFLQPELYTIQRVRVTDRFPEAHTCANTLDLPEYESKEDLARRLLFAIDETGDAFGRI